MAVLNIELNNLTNGQQVVIPFEVHGTVSGPGGVNLNALSRQIDDNALVTINLPNNPTALPHNFSFEITLADCPDVNTWYMVTVYAWDTENACTIFSLSFKRVPTPTEDV